MKLMRQTAYTVKEIIDPGKEREWASEIGMQRSIDLVACRVANISLSGGLDWDRTQIVFTKRTLVGKRDGAVDLAWCQLVPCRVPALHRHEREPKLRVRSYQCKCLVRDLTKCLSQKHRQVAPCVLMSPPWRPATSLTLDGRLCTVRRIFRLAALHTGGRGYSGPYCRGSEVARACSCSVEQSGIHPNSQGSGGSWRLRQRCSCLWCRGRDATCCETTTS